VTGRKQQENDEIIIDVLRPFGDGLFIHEENHGGESGI
jgi:hypothetical protein